MKNITAIKRYRSLLGLALLIIVPMVFTSCNQDSADTNSNKGQPAENGKGKADAAEWEIQLLDYKILQTAKEGPGIGSDNALISIRVSVNHKGTGEPAITPEKILLNTPSQQISNLYGLAPGKSEHGQFNFYSFSKPSSDVSYVDNGKNAFTLRAKDGMLVFPGAENTILLGFPFPKDAPRVRLRFGESNAIKINLKD